MRSSGPSGQGAAGPSEERAQTTFSRSFTLRSVAMIKPPCNLTQLIHRRVASRIRRRRLQVGMTQQQLARIIGVAFQEVHKYEHGLSRVSADRLYQIATPLDAPVGYFFSAEDGRAPAEEGVTELQSKYETNEGA